MPRRGLIWAGLLCIALAARCAAAVMAPAEPDADERAYIELAENISRLEGFTRGSGHETHISPLFPSLHAVGLWLGMEGATAGLALALLASSVAALLAGLVISEAFGFGPGLTAGIVVALHPGLISASRDIQPEGLAATLILCFVWSRLRGKHELAAAALGLGYLARPELICLAGLWLAVVAFRRRLETRRLVACALVVLAFCAPQIIYLWIVTGALCISGKDLWVYTVGVGQGITGREAVPWELMQRLQIEVTGVFPHIVTHPGQFMTGYAIRAGLLMRNLVTIMMLPYVLGAAWGIAWAWRHHRETLLLILFPLALLAIMPIGMTIQRHLLTVAPLLIALSGLGVYEAGRLARGLW